MGELIAATGRYHGSGPVFRGDAEACETVQRILTEARPRPAAAALLGAQRLPVHLNPVAVRVKALVRHVGCFIVPFHDGDAIILYAFHQRAYVSWRCGLEAGMQERWRRFDLPNRVQS